MNHSIYTADRTTHMKIVVIAMAIGIAGVGLGLSSRSHSDADMIRTAAVFKAGKPVVMTRSEASVVR